MGQQRMDRAANPANAMGRSGSHSLPCPFTHVPGFLPWSQVEGGEVPAKEVMRPEPLPSGSGGQGEGRRWDHAQMPK